jgi:hypothetical protein
MYGCGSIYINTSIRVFGKYACARSALPKKQNKTGMPERPGKEKRAGCLWNVQLLKTENSCSERAAAAAFGNAGRGASK